jgi:esterase/lipase
MFKFILNHMPGMQLKMLGITKKEFLEADSTEQKNIEQLFNTILPIKPKKKGIRIDLKTIVPDMTINYSDYPIEKIECPILILHAKNDPMAEYEKMEVAMKRLRNVETVLYEDGGHVLFGHGQENKRAIANFIQKWSE